MTDQRPTTDHAPTLTFDAWHRPFTYCRGKGCGWVGRPQPSADLAFSEYDHHIADTTTDQTGANR